MEEHLKVILPNHFVTYYDITDMISHIQTDINAFNNIVSELKYYLGMSTNDFHTFINTSDQIKIFELYFKSLFTQRLGINKALISLENMDFESDELRTLLNEILSLSFRLYLRIILTSVNMDGNEEYSLLSSVDDGLYTNNIRSQKNIGSVKANFITEIPNMIDFIVLFYNKYPDLVIVATIHVMKIQDTKVQNLENELEKLFYTILCEEKPDIKAEYIMDLYSLFKCIQILYSVDSSGPYLLIIQFLIEEYSNHGPYYQDKIIKLIRLLLEIAFFRPLGLVKRMIQFNINKIKDISVPTYESKFGREQHETFLKDLLYILSELNEEMISKIIDDEYLNILNKIQNLNVSNEYIRNHKEMMSKIVKILQKSKDLNEITSDDIEEMILAIKEIFPKWTDEEILHVLKSTNYDLCGSVHLITEQGRYLVQDCIMGAKKNRCEDLIYIKEELKKPYVGKNDEKIHGISREIIKARELASMRLHAANKFDIDNFEKDMTELDVKPSQLELHEYEDVLIDAYNRNPILFTKEFRRTNERLKLLSKTEMTHEQLEGWAIIRTRKLDIKKSQNSKNSNIKSGVVISPADHILGPIIQTPVVHEPGIIPETKKKGKKPRGRGIYRQKEKATAKLHHGSYFSGQ